jgi:DNA-binding response OmpR family regulator
LLSEVWGKDTPIANHTLQTHIYRLRQKIEPNTASPRILVTESGGYRLNPDGIPLPESASVTCT